MVINRPIPSEVITQMGNLGRPAPAKDRVGVFAELDYFLFADDVDAGGATSLHGRVFGRRTIIQIF